MNSFFEQDIFIIFDTEQTAWEGSNLRNWSGENEHREIIQIGAIKVKKINNKYEVIEKINDTGYIYVKPRINKVLSEYITNLTGITNKNIEDEGVEFEDALNKFSDFCKNHNIYSYGDDINDVTIDNIRLYKNRFPTIDFNNCDYDKLSKNSHDITKLFQLYGIDTSKYTSGTVYKSLNIKVNNDKNHFSLWDCFSILLTINELILRYKITL